MRTRRIVCNETLTRLTRDLRADLINNRNERHRLEVRIDELSEERAHISAALRECIAIERGR